MSYPFGGMYDELNVSTRLYLKLDLAMERETVLHFFDSVRREFPGMRKLRRREDALILEEDASEEGARRWLRLESSAIRFGFANPERPEDVARLSNVVLEMAPFHLTLGDLDYDHLEVLYGFDLEYRGNHDQLVAETLLGDHPIVNLLTDERRHPIIDCQPFIGVALTDDCDVQAYIDIKSRTTTYEVRTCQYETQYLTVYLTLRKYWGFGEAESLLAAHRNLLERADELAAEKVVPLIVNPLAQAIASQR
ncbi:MAG: hypothetical protein L6Q92_01000 [Phycisphaerae bacterium]|nr:hypothetical protein [Phycisphaerae bacterium]